MPRVIKADTPYDVARVGKAAALNIANFAEQAQKMVIEAQTRSSQIIAQATTKARELEKLSQQRGYAEGLQKGVADGQADGAEKAFQEAMKNFSRQTADLQQMLKQTVRKLEEARNDILVQARNELLNLSLAIAEKITRVQAQGDVEVAKASLGKAIEMVGCSGQIQVRVSPVQLAQLQEYGAEFLGEMGLLELVKFVPDEGLTPGDVVLTTRNGEVDARIEAQIDNIVAALTGREK